jgi:cell cycle sensor histidine kinase DivJ
VGQKTDFNQRVVKPNRSADGLDEASRDDRLWSLGWRLAWIVTPVVAAALLALMQLATPAALSAVLLCAVPAGLSFVTLSTAGPVGMTLWAVCAVLACGLTGGLAGPFAVLTATPLAVALIEPGGRGRDLSLAALIAFIAVALAGIANLTGLAQPAPPGVTGAALGAGATIGIVLTLAAGALNAQYGAATAHRRQERRNVQILALMEGQPHLVLSLDMEGRARSIYGRLPPGVSEAALRNAGIEAVAQAADRVAVRAAVNAAVLDGEAEVRFTPEAAPDSTLGLALRRQGENLMIAVLRDATIDRAREALLENARTEAENRAAGRARFLANMSHELRTPLNAIMGFSDMIRQRMFGPVSDRYGEYVDLIHESGGHLLDLINDLLDMSKIEADKFELSREIFDSREAVTAALRLMRVQADGVGVRLRGVLPARPLEIDADRRALKQIVLNLVSNAIKFTPKGGSVTVAAQGHGQNFELIVADTGAGIAPEDIERLGKPYEQAGDPKGRSLGTGLGLSLVRGLSQLHGGEMIIESRLGAGTSVTVRMPVMAQPLAQPPLPSGDEPVVLGDNVVAFTAPRGANGETL